MRGRLTLLALLVACEPPAPSSRTPRPPPRASTAAAASVARALTLPPSPAGAFRFSPRANRAAEITWQPWGSAAFEAARASGRPVFLSLAAVWCHWCHVLDETTLSDPRVIARLNNETVPVRVDADQHPDVERRYILGGWPTVALLDLDARILDGASYLPAADLLALLDRALPVFRAEPAGAFRTLGGPDDAARDEAAPGALRDDDDAQFDRALRAQLDRAHGGLVGRPKFPFAPLLDRVLARAATGDVTAATDARRWLDAIDAGLYDPVEGGFYRYATQADWSAPHFEKMAVGNAELIMVFARAAVVLREPRYAARARGAWQWAERTLADGALFSASQDADPRYAAATEPAARAAIGAPYVDRTHLAAHNAELALAGLTAAEALGDGALRTQARARGRAALVAFVSDEGAVYRVEHAGERVAAGDLADVGPMLELCAALERVHEPGALARGRAVLAWARAHLAAPDGALYDAQAPLAGVGVLAHRYRAAALNARYAEGVAAMARVARDRSLAAHVREVAAVFEGGARRVGEAAARFARARALVVGL